MNSGFSFLSRLRPALDGIQMVKLVVQWAESARDEVCALCAAASVGEPGLRLCLADGLAAVCSACGRRHAPALGALLELAQVAEQVGRVSAHSRLWVPLEMQLELTRASEMFYTLVASGRTAG